MKIICVANQKGGVGKTTTVLELGVCLSNLGKKVLLVDFDQQCNLSTVVNVDFSKPTIYDLISGDADFSSAVQHMEFFDIISSSEKLSKADKEFTDQDDVYCLDDVLKFTNEYDYVLIDNSPSRNILLSMSYVASDYVIAPCECDDFSLNGIIAVNKDLVKLRDSRNHYSHAEFILFILNKYEKTMMHNSALESLEELAKQFGNNIEVLKVRKSIAASEAKTANMSLQEYSKYSNVAVDYRAIAKKIIERCE